PRAETEHARLRRRGDDADVPTRPALVDVRRVEQLDPEVLTGAERNLLAVEVEDDEQRPLRDLPLLLDCGPHMTPFVTPPARVLPDRKHELEPRAVRLGVGVEHVPVMRPRVRPGDRQPEPCSVPVRATPVAAREALEELWYELRNDAASTVLDHDPE